MAQKDARSIQAELAKPFAAEDLEWRLQKTFEAQGRMTGIAVPCVICPEYQPLAYRTTNRDGYREYCSDPKVCAQCPTRKLCTRSKNCVKTVLRHVWKDYEELADDARYTPEYKELYAKRKETIERVFADAKEKHGMRYTLYRGLAQVSKWVRLKFAAMNLKKLARWKANRQSRLSFLLFSAHMYLLCFAACLDISQAGRFSTG